MSDVQKLTAEIEYLKDALRLRDVEVVQLRAEIKELREECDKFERREYASREWIGE